MASSNYPAAVKLVLKHEGGYVNNPNDNGGATNKGITQGTYDAFRKDRGLSTRTVKSITSAEIDEIYRKRYWDAVEGDQLAYGVDYAIFDFAVNSGPSRAAAFAQRIAGVDDDGKIGPITIAAIKKVGASLFIQKLCNDRLAWLKTLPDWKHFGKGWNNRIIGVRSSAIDMVGTVEPDPEPVDETEDLKARLRQIHALSAP